MNDTEAPLNIYKKNFKTYFRPMLIQFVITGIMNSADKLIAALFIGSKALVATGLISPILIFGIAISGMFSSGAGTYLGIMKGRGKIEQANKVITALLILVTIFSFLLTALLYYYRHSVVNFLGAKGVYHTLTLQYIPFIALFLFFMSLAGVVRSCIMNDGSPKFVAFSMSFMTVTNVVLNIVFVIAFKMGIVGLGLATAISSFLALLMSFYYLLFKSSVIKISRPKFDFKAILNIHYNGSSSFLSMASIGVSILAINYSFLKFLPSYYLEGYNIAVMFTIFIRHPYMASSMGIQPVISKEFGAQNYNIVKGQIHYSILRSISYAVLMYVSLIPVVYFATPFFTQDANVIMAAHHVYIGLGFAFLFMPITLQVPSFYTAMGRPLESLIFSMTRSLFLVPILVVTFVSIFDDYGLYIAYIFTDIVLSIVILTYMYKRDISTLESKV